MLAKPLSACALAAVFLLTAIPVGGADTSPASPPPWPVEGSSLQYVFQSSAWVPDGSWSEHVAGTVNMIFEDGAWTAACFGERAETHDGFETTTDFLEHPTMSPLRQTEAADGEVIEMGYMDECQASVQDGVAASDYTHAMYGDLGRVMTLAVERGTEADGEGEFRDLHSVADQNLGMVLSWNHWRRMSHDWGMLTGTDAPLGTVLSAETQKAMVGPFAKEGAVVVQHWCRMAPDDWCSPEDSTKIRFTYQDGVWTGRCRGVIAGAPVDMVVDFGPARAPKGVAPSADVPVERIRGCEKVTTMMHAGGTEPTAVARCCPWDAPVFVEARLAGAPYGVDQVRRMAWDIETRLVLESETRNNLMYTGRTNLPLV